MVEYGFPRRTESEDSRLGQRLVRTAMETSTMPVLDQLRESTGETAQLWFRRGQEQVCAPSFDDHQELRAALPGAPGLRCRPVFVSRAPARRQVEVAGRRGAES